MNREDNHIYSERQGLLLGSYRLVCMAAGCVAETSATEAVGRAAKTRVCFLFGLVREWRVRFDDYRSLVRRMCKNNRAHEVFVVRNLR
jgi:hypothetical protein